jgi:hypothetical protein
MTTMDEGLKATSAWFNENLATVFERMEADRNGSARQCQWDAEDGWVIVYTTARVKGGPHDGRFVVLTYKPEGKGSRSGDPSRWVCNYKRAFSTRKAAKARAVQLYYQHSPKAALRHGVRQ